jgi:hypothetical protein
MTEATRPHPLGIGIEPPVAMATDRRITGLHLRLRRSTWYPGEWEAEGWVGRARLVGRGASPVAAWGELQRCIESMGVVDRRARETSDVVHRDVDGRTPAPPREDATGPIETPTSDPDISKDPGLRSTNSSIETP